MTARPTEVRYSASAGQSSWLFTPATSYDSSKPAAYQGKQVSALVPITDEQAKALASVAETGKEVIGVAEKAGSWFVEIVQGVPQDLIGVMGGNWLHHKRRRNLAILEARTAAYLEHVSADRRFEPSSSVLVPLLTAAADESREGLQALWAALLANAMVDEGRKVRREFFDLLRQLEPSDAIVLNLLGHPPLWQRPLDPNEAVVHVARKQQFVLAAESLGLSAAGLEVSLDALGRLHCVKLIPSGFETVPALTPMATALVSACDVE